MAWMAIIGIQCQLVICRGPLGLPEGPFQEFLQLTVLSSIEKLSNIMTFLKPILNGFSCNTPHFKAWNLLYKIAIALWWSDAYQGHKMAKNADVSNFQSIFAICNPFREVLLQCSHFVFLNVYFFACVFLCFLCSFLGQGCFLKLSLSTNFQPFFVNLLQNFSCHALLGILYLLFCCNCINQTYAEDFKIEKN